MKFTCLKENLYPGLALIAPMARKASHLPILGNILIKAETGSLMCSVTNLELAVKVTIRAKVEEEGMGTFPAKVLYEVVGSLPKDKIECTSTSDVLSLSAQGFQGTVKGVSSDEFPVIPQVQGTHTCTFQRQEFIGVLEQTMFAASHQDPRQELNGVSFWFSVPSGSASGGKTTLRIAATDSYRLAEATLTLPTPMSEPLPHIIIPARSLSEVVRILSSSQEEHTTLDMVWEESQVLFSCGNVAITSRLIAGKYPEYQAIIPTSFRTTARMKRTELLALIKQVSLFSSSGLHEITLALDPQTGVLTGTGSCDQVGEGSANITCEIIGEAQKAVFNHTYLVEGLQALSGDMVELGMIDASSPTIMRIPGSEGYLYLAMPIKQ